MGAVVRVYGLFGEDVGIFGCIAPEYRHAHLRFKGIFLFLEVFVQRLVVRDVNAGIDLFLLDSEAQLHIDAACWRV